MSDRESVLLVVLVQTAQHRWHVGAVREAGQSLKLFQSEPGNLDAYEDLEADAQVSFLRHRLAGVLQRGCDRLYARQMRATRFLIVTDDDFVNSADGVTERLAEHFAEWMMNPPVTFLRLPGFAGEVTSDAVCVLAGEIDEDVASALREPLAKLVTEIEQPDGWELIASR